MTFNIDSPKQLGQVLFDVLKLDDKPKQTRTGQYTTSEDVLEKLAAKHSIAQYVLDFRHDRKLLSTYVEALPTYIAERTGRVHTNFSQAVAVTGRMASHNPNLQNIPIRTPKGRQIRKAFVAGDDSTRLIAADYSQIELRIIAHLSQDPGMSEAFQSGQDIHRTTAAKVYGVMPELVTDDMRRNAKMVNFGIAYGISAFGLAQRLRIPRKEAKFIIDQYFIQYGGVRDYMDATLKFAQENGYVETVSGRRRYLRDINSRNHTVRSAAERNAINSPIQGTAADMIKIAMVNIDRALRDGDYQTKLLLQVHDELVFEAPVDEVDTVKTLIRREMADALKLNVPIEVEIGVGHDWLEAH
jgi:DNA polymerase-1